MRKGQRVTASGLPGWCVVEGVVMAGDGAREGKEVLVWAFLSWPRFWVLESDGTENQVKAQQHKAQ